MEFYNFLVIQEKEKSSQLPANESADWERLADGSVGRITEFHGANDIPIAAYIRKPEGQGPFPVVVMEAGNLRPGAHDGCTDR